MLAICCTLRVRVLVMAPITTRGYFHKILESFKRSLLETSNKSEQAYSTLGLTELVYNLIICRGSYPQNVPHMDLETFLK